MDTPPSMGAVFRSGYRKVFADVAEETGVTLIPFVLEGVAGVSRLNQHDGIHPTEKGHEIVAKLVWETMRPLIATR